MNVSKFYLFIVLFFFFLLLCLTVNTFPSLHMLFFISSAFLLSLYYSYQTRRYEVFFAVTLIITKAPILMLYYPPLAPPDAEGFYNYAFGGELSSFTDTIQSFFELRINIVEMTAYLYKSISWYVSSQNVIALVYVNYFLVLISGLLIWRVYKKSAGLIGSGNKGLYLYVFFIVMSPLLNKYSTYLLKESLSLFLICFTVYSIQNVLTQKRYLAVLYVVPAVIVATIVRPYNFVYILSFLVFFGFFSNKKTLFMLIVYLISVLIYFTLLQSGSILEVIKNIILSMLAIIAAPNFMRVDSWAQIPVLLFESIFLFFFFSIYFALSNWDVKFKLFASILLISITLGGVSYNRSTKIEQLHSIKEGSLLSDDIARKKFSFQILLLLLPIIVVRRNLKT